MLAWTSETGIVLTHLSLAKSDRLQGRIGEVNSIAFSPDGKLLASGGMDHEIELWDVATLQRFPMPMMGHTDIVWKVAFSPDGSTLGSSGNDKTIRLWDVNFDSWMARACRIANRNLTFQEWSQYVGAKPYSKTCPSFP
jgi:WD40 repeat protein